MELTKEKTFEMLRETSMSMNWIIMDRPDLPVSKELIDQFNNAATLSKANKLSEALKAWDALLTKAPPGSKLVATAEFVGMAHMRKAWVLMDMNKFDEAKKIFESNTLRATLRTVPQDFLFEYYRSYGNTLVELGDKTTGEEMLAYSKRFSMN